MANNFNPVWEYADFNWFTYIIAFMINCVTQTFFDCRIWVVKKTIRLCFVRKFDYMFLNWGYYQDDSKIFFHGILQIVKRDSSDREDIIRIERKNIKISCLYKNTCNI